MSSEEQYRIVKADAIRDAKGFHKRLIKEASKPLDIHIVGVLGQVVKPLEGDHRSDLVTQLAHVLSENLTETSHRDYGVGFFTTSSPEEIADAVVSLLNNEKGQ